MPSVASSESNVEEAALARLSELGYQVLHGGDIAFDARDAERNDPYYRDVNLERRLRQALARLNLTSGELWVKDAVGVVKEING